MKSFTKMIILLAVFILPNFAFAAKNSVPLCDVSMDNFFGAMQEFGSQVGVNMWNANYSTKKGVDVGEVHFGEEKNNLISCLANKSGATDSVEISFATSEETAEQAGASLGLVLVLSGINETEYENFTEMISVDMDNTLDNLNKVYKVWCETAQRHIVIKADINSMRGMFVVSAQK